MSELDQRFTRAREAYLELIERDFPDYAPEDHLQENVAGKDDGEDLPRPPLRKKVLESLDFSGDGRLGRDDVVSAAQRARENTTTAVRDAGRTISGFNAAGIRAMAGTTVGSLDVSKIASASRKIGRTATGMHGIHSRRAAKEVREICGEYYEAAGDITERHRGCLNDTIEGFGEYRLYVLHRVVGRFLRYLEQLEQRNSVKEYKILIGTELTTEKLAELERIDMAASEALRTTAVAGAFGTVAVLGTPALVTTSVAALATASTGTAISGLSGVAATNATLAWLGGGSLAAGGGGMAAGAVALTAITASATTVTSILAAGTLVSLHYGKKLTEAKEYEKEVGLAVAQLEKSWIVMDGIAERTAELRQVTEELELRASTQLDELEALIPDFDFKDPAAVVTFNSCALLVKAMTELAQTPLLDEEGNLSHESLRITGKIRSVLNTEV
jgi:hypothetical protein